MKEFNYKGSCIPVKHFMVHTSSRLEPALDAIKKGEYLTLSYPRQFGKTTTLLLLEWELVKQGYLPVSLSFEGIGDIVFEQEDAFARTFAELISETLAVADKELAAFVLAESKTLRTLKDLSLLITKMVKKRKQKIILLVDEVDKSSNNQLFLSFLGMLRDKYLKRNAGKDSTFHSVILAGIYDITSLKLKIRVGGEAKYNSPWNIAMNYPGDLSFSAEEIGIMLGDYSREKQISMDIEIISQKLAHFTSGYPFLVSRLCAIIDTDILRKGDARWSEEYVNEAVARLLKENNTNFGSLIKNLENNPELYALVEEILLRGRSMEFSEHNQLIRQGMIHGVFRKGKELRLNNPVYEELLYNYMTLNLKIKSLLDKNLENYAYPQPFLLPGNALDFEKILKRFQIFMQEQYSPKENRFVERNWRLLFLAFIKPIINGHGFDFKEAQISEEKRLDVVITFYNRKYVSELKIWDGAQKHERGIRQLADYLKQQNLDTGYLVVFDFKKVMEYKQEWVNEDGCKIFIVWV